MRFFVGNAPVVSKDTYVFLEIDNWDDYHYKTSFYAYLFRNGEKVDIGPVKILHRQSDTYPDYRLSIRHIEESFTSLSSEWCSLGQTLDFYRNLRKLPPAIYEQVLTGLRDVATDSRIASSFIGVRGFKVSLLRFSEAEKAFNEAKGLFGAHIEKVLKFTFRCKLDDADEAHVVDMDFSTSELPHRINAFVGKNGTGKTKVLTELASVLSGVKANNDYFTPTRPSFNKIITISYSAFDELYKPFNDDSAQQAKPKNEKQDERVLFSYVYCGLRTRKGILTLDDLESNFFSALSEVEDRRRVDEWEHIMRNVFQEEHMQMIDQLKGQFEQHSREKTLASYLSSGQNILLSTMTEVIANIQEDSLLLFDEPEIHLHPNAIANFMRMLYDILNQFNSYAVISTHSPIVLQEIPSRYVHVFSRIANTPVITRPSLECFGENISNITNDVFEVREYESNYKTIFRNLAEKYSKDAICELFDEELSFNALTYLNSLNYNNQ